MITFQDCALSPAQHAFLRVGGKMDNSCMVAPALSETEDYVFDSGRVLSLHVNNAQFSRIRYSRPTYAPQTTELDPN